MIACACLGIGELLIGLTFLVLGWLGIRKKKEHHHGK